MNKSITSAINSYLRQASNQSHHACENESYTNDQQWYIVQYDKLSSMFRVFNKQQKRSPHFIVIVGNGRIKGYHYKGFYSDNKYFIFIFNFFFIHFLHFFGKLWDLKKRRPTLIGVLESYWYPCSIQTNLKKRLTKFIES